MNLTPVIREEKERIEKLMKTLRSLDPLNDAILFSSMSEYICVRISGYLESGLDSLLITFVEQETKNQRLRSVAIKHIEGYQSATYSQICDLLLSFDKSLNESFKTQIQQSDKDIPTDINALVKQRNLIAHGGRTELGREALNRYFITAQKVLEIIARQLN